MGTFNIQLEVGNLAGEQFIQVLGLVDTGSTYTVVPEDILERIGVERVEQRPFELANDQVEEYWVGSAMIRLDGRQLPALVVFGPKDVMPLVGATTLETFGLAVDPVHRGLIPVRALLKRRFL